MDPDGKNIFIAMMTIDTHVHFWKYNPERDSWMTDEMKLLRQDYLPEHFASTARNNRIDGLVAVQVDQSELENHFLLELAATHPQIKGIVGWIDFRNPNLPERLQYFHQFPLIKGWRHIVQGEPADFLLRPDFRKGVAQLFPYNYTYDILIYHHQLAAAVDFVQQLPHQKLVIDHCAKPDIKSKAIGEWKKHMRTLAKHPNVYCKLSGLLTETHWKNWSAADFYPYLDVVFESFGTDRLIFGSDWPVILLSGIYVQWKSLLEKYMEPLSPEAQEQVFGGNAVTFYGL